MLCPLFIYYFFQDISVDSVAIRILKPDELGAGNTVQVLFLFSKYTSGIFFYSVFHTKDYTERFKFIFKAFQNFISLLQFCSLLQFPLTV